MALGDYLDNPFIVALPFFIAIPGYMLYEDAAQQNTIDAFMADISAGTNGGEIVSTTVPERNLDQASELATRAVILSLPQDGTDLGLLCYGTSASVGAFVVKILPDGRFEREADTSNTAACSFP